MKYQDSFLLLKNQIFIASSDDTIFLFLTVKISFLFDNIFFVPLTTLKFVDVWSKHIRIFFGRLRQSSENVRKRSSGLRNNFGKSSEIFGRWSKILGKLNLLRSLVRYWVEHSKIKFVSTCGHVLSSILYKQQWNPKPFHFRCERRDLLCNHNNCDLFTCKCIKFSRKSPPGIWFKIM